MQDKVAVVTGASRGVGKGIALGLGEAVASVYITGRTEQEGQGPDFLPGNIHQTVRDVELTGGRARAIHCDHRDDRQVEAAFEQVIAEQGRIEILVNNVWGGYEYMLENNRFTWAEPFWNQPLWRWDAMFQAGVRAHYTSSIHAARKMTAQRCGLIVNIAFWAGQKYIANTAYCVAKAATDRLTSAMAYELRGYNVAVISLYPGLVRTESVMRAAEFFDFSNSESPQFEGRAIAVLAADPDVIRYSGQVLVSAAVGQEYGFTDIDGRQPIPVTIDEV